MESPTYAKSQSVLCYNLAGVQQSPRRQAPSGVYCDGSAGEHLAGPVRLRSQRPTDYRPLARAAPRSRRTYRNRIAGERSESLEEAKGCFRRALGVYPREAFASEHDLATQNLESALRELDELTSGESA